MADLSGGLLEDYIPVVKFSGIRTNKDMTFGDSATVALPAATTIAGVSVVALGNITSSSTSATAFSVTNSGIFTGASVVAFTANSATTGTIALFTANGLTSGHLLSLVSTGTIVTTGDVLSIAANTATTSTGLLRISGTGLTDGFAVAITSGGANLTASGGGINLSMGAATVGTGLAIATTGVYTGTTGLIGITATSATTGTLVAVSAAGLTTGKAISLTLNGLTTGNGLLIASSSTDTGTRGLIQLTQSGAGATGTSMIRMTQVVTSTNYRKIFSESGSGVTLWFGNGTTANGNLTGTAGDICFNGGSNKPEYCTGTTTWVALV